MVLHLSSDNMLRFLKFISLYIKPVSNLHISAYSRIPCLPRHDANIWSVTFQHLGVWHANIWERNTPKFGIAKSQHLRARHTNYWEGDTPKFGSSTVCTPTLESEKREHLGGWHANIWELTTPTFDSLKCQHMKVSSSSTYYLMQKG